MILLIDWGNTYLKYVELGSESISLDVAAPQARDQYLEFLEKVQINTVVSLETFHKHLKYDYELVLVSSVRDECDNMRLKKVLTTKAKRVNFAASAAISCGVSCGYDNPSRLGVDRWLGILGSKAISNKRVVVSVGSAITMDVVKGNRHLGGQIVPGYRLLIESLLTTGKVRPACENEVDTNFRLGSSTEASVINGLNSLINGYLSQILINCIVEYDVNNAIFTGGGGDFWSKQLNIKGLQRFYEQKLVFKGLIILFTATESIR